MRLVLDTDVVLSGLRSTVGASRILLLAVEAGVVTPLVSVAMVIEYEAVWICSSMPLWPMPSTWCHISATGRRSVILTMRYSSRSRSTGTPMRS